ncbi:MAG: DUF424 domain-containing protein [Thermoplasmatota archaeon]
MNISYQIYERGNDVLLAACDKELLGKKFEEEEIQLDVSESFYGGDEADKEKICDEIKRSNIVNLVGENIINAVIQAGFGNEEDVLWIDGTPHLQLIMI